VYIVPASFLASPSLAMAQNLLVGHETAASRSDEPIGVSALQVAAPACDFGAAADAPLVNAPLPITAARASATLTTRRRAISARGRRKDSITAVIYHGTRVRVPPGFYVDTPTAWVPLTFTAGHRSRTVCFGMGKSC
jgi:hypothetical protein